MSLTQVSNGSTGFAAFEAALSSAGLPVTDLDADGAQYFTLEYHDGQPTAFIGLISFGPEGLLRSLIVPHGLRGQGYGAQAINDVAQLARGIGIHRLWLLTTGAEGYFVRHGFRFARRGEAPTAIANSQQFSITCPDTAVLMCLTLV
jgi:amino-acid N-acetyltransferase